MKGTLKSSKRISVPALPKADPDWKSLTGSQIEKSLRIQGFRPTDARIKRRLIASGNWGMPDE